MDLTTTDENQVNACQTSGLDTFSKENLTTCEKYVLSIQRRLDKAVANDDRTKIRWYTHILSKRSRAVKILAVHKICKVNTGRYTAGVDGVSTPTERKRQLPMMMTMLKNINITARPDPIRRVYIPKPNGDKRPLGIPTLKDRINQEIIRQAIEPICESHFLPCSYGFRPLRGCQDAMSDLFLKLARRNSRRWIIEGDIKGCFDHIKHSHIISTLTSWRVSTSITEIIKGFLKADIMEEMRIHASDEGTPQGGVISPMLANVALTCLDEEILKKYGKEWRGQNQIVRYADDFVIVMRTKAQAENAKSHISTYLKTQTGLTLSDEKTRITEISKGFDFLGFNFRKYGIKEKLLIKPSKDKIKGVKRRIKGIFNDFSDNTPDILIRNLTPITVGWANYYRHIVSKSTYTEIDNYIWGLTKRYVKRRHPKTRSRYWTKKYFTTVRKDHWIFYDKDTGTKLRKLVWIPIKRFIKVKSDKRVYDANAREYWEIREYQNAKDAMLGSALLTKLYREQKGRCEYCGQPITDQQIKQSTMHKHHMNPRSEGGDEKPSNLRLIHSVCHQALHGICSRKKMANFINKGIDYLRLLKPIKQ